MGKATSSERLAVEPVRESRAASRLKEGAAAIAHLALEGCSGSACLIGWHRGATSGEERLFAVGHDDSPFFNSTLDRLLAISQRTAVEPANPSDSLSIKILSPDDLTPLLHSHRNGDERFDAALAIGRSPESLAHVLLVATGRGSSATLKGTASLALRALLSNLSAESDREGRDFWRDRAGTNAAKLAEMQQRLKTSATDVRALDSAVAAAQRLRQRNRLDRAGAIVAGSGPFTAWVVAVVDQEMWRVAAVSGVAAPSGSLAPDSALAACYKRRAAIVRGGQNKQSCTYAEDRLFEGFANYLCVPFDGGAFALAAREPIDQATIERVEALVARLNPLLRSWRLEAEAVRLRALVRNLALRMYGAAETERARIARDLHDHQAQLMAAARIAIEAGPDEARAILKQVDEALRLRVRELRPATLGRTSLADGLRYELRRLAEAGIKGRLLHPDQMNSLTRALQQLCYQVAREALANVIRHAGASNVAIDVVKQGSRVRLSIRDNGRGVPAVSATGGVGLKGLRERVELMGGKLKMESRPGKTCLIVELTEPV